MPSIEHVVSKLRNADAELTLNKDRVVRFEQELEGLEDYMELVDRTQKFLTKLSKEAQEEIREYIEDMVSLVLQSTFGEEYEFVIELESKRDQMEISFKVRQYEVALELKNDSLGGGIVDVCAFTLRIVLWSLENPEAAPIILLDEPFKYVSEGFEKSVSNMLKDLAKMLNLQIIMVTHNRGLMKAGDRIFELN